MDSGTLVQGFVPIASAAIGAGATFLWQRLGNDRTDKAVRVQTNARLVELTTFLGHIYESKSLSANIAPTLQRIVASLDDLQIALAFRNDPDMLWKLGQIRVSCERIGALDDESTTTIAAGDSAQFDLLRDKLQRYAGNVLVLIVETIRDSRMRLLATTTASHYGFSAASHDSRLKGHVVG